jgi:hypothetical protein
MVIKCSLSTSAVAGNRDILLSIGTGVDLQGVLMLPAQQAVGPGTILPHSFIRGLGGLASSTLTLVRARECPDIILQPTWTVQLSIANLQAGDIFTSVNLPNAITYLRRAFA